MVIDSDLSSQIIINSSSQVIQVISTNFIKKLYSSITKCKIQLFDSSLVGRWGFRPWTSPLETPAGANQVTRLLAMQNSTTHKDNNYNPSLLM